jgi:hypothetical protein
MNDIITTLRKAGHVAAASLVFGLAGAGPVASPAHDHSPGYKAMSMKDDLAPDIHWPTGFEPERAGWYGYMPGAKPSFYHSWYLAPEGTMCHVVMDEAGVGKDAADLRKSDETLMHRGHDLWLATLKWVAEAK